MNTIIMVSSLQKNLHLLWRAGFGPDTAAFKLIDTVSARELLRTLFNESATPPAFIDVASPEVKKQYATSRTVLSAMPQRRANNQSQNREQTTDNNQTQRNERVNEMQQAGDKRSAENNRRKIAQQSRENIKELNLRWLSEMADSKQQLREKIALFWHGHFAANSGNILHQQLLLDIIRKNALGNFGDLLKAVSKSGSMINYLNNNQNRKNSPNENFAREVMELFTLGRGNYTEHDVKEAARAFTGWGTNPSGEFLFRKQQHDAGVKTFLGKTGNFSGDDILEILLQQKQTAQHITTKIYRFYVNENPDQSRVQKLAADFYASGYDISKLLSSIFESDWFYADENIGNRIKSPVELIVGLRRNLRLDIQNQQVQLLFQRLLGQVLFYPPNVAGWPGGFNWIDSSSLMLRLQIPKMIIDADEVNLAPKNNDDQMMGMMDPQVEGAKPRKNLRNGGQAIQATINWQEYLAMFEKTKRENLLTTLSSVLLVTKPAHTKLVNDQFLDASSRESFIKSATIRLMCTPEYQVS